jgi:hypothetical protein
MKINFHFLIATNVHIGATPHPMKAEKITAKIKEIFPNSMMWNHLSNKFGGYGHSLERFHLIMEEMKWVRDSIIRLILLEEERNKSKKNNHERKERRNSS